MWIFSKPGPFSGRLISHFGVFGVGSLYCGGVWLKESLADLGLVFSCWVQVFVSLSLSPSLPPSLPPSLSPFFFCLSLFFFLSLSLSTSLPLFGEFHKHLVIPFKDLANRPKNSVFEAFFGL